MNNERLQVVYILGMGRSGTTLLHRILGQMPGSVAVGETFLMWERNLLQNRMCGCGVRFHSCQTWKGIFKNAFGSFDGVDAEEIVRFYSSNLRTRHLPALMRLRRRKDQNAEMKSIAGNLEKLFHSISFNTNSRVIVDSSKWPSYALFLSTIGSIDLKVLHIVRDPRAVVYAWQKYKLQPDGGSDKEYMGRMNPWFSSMLWNAWNIAGDKLEQFEDVKYHRIYWEEFIRNPEQTVRGILTGLQLPQGETPFIDQRTVELSAQHTVSGNPDRFLNGEIRINHGQEWRESIKPVHKLTCNILTYPMLLKYGYLH